ncbi:cell wall-binding repeat-containing protein [Sutcliffiella horikoshii]|uniref:cell wall-binding repeat-containing protein n=1 Tax=Sutcliffiella horikoshii TaxID=79883 RepID=UPI003850BD3B
MNVKKILMLMMVFLLVFSNAALAVTPLTAPERTKPVTGKNGELALTKAEAEEEKYKLDDKVRVIVEVEGAPAIEYATKEGKKFAELSEAKKTELQNKALSAQEAVKSQLSSKRLKVDYKESFTTAFNGFSGVVEYGRIAEIEKISGVSKVTIATEYQRPVEEPNMKYSKELVEAQMAWDEYGYNGEGMIIGIIDTGIDPSHRDMVLTDDSAAALSEEAVEGFISDNDLPGMYHTAKVPYGYNYMDKNQEVLDLGPGASYHGMHVAGTAGANGDEENGGIKGVAPEAQLLALKVFGNDPDMGSTWGDIYIKAIDDSIILGADVINMSLGSTASFVDENNPEQQAIARAVDNGVVMAISAGNSAHLGNGYWNPYASNPDVGVVGAPGLSYDSLQVASLENSFMDLDAAESTFDGEEGELHPFLSASSVHPTSLEEDTFDLVHVGGGGTGVKADWAEGDYEGKFVLVRRGNTFTDTAFNAQDAGAAGVIVYNHSEGYVSMQSDPAIQIPQLFMLKVDGDQLAAKIAEGVEVTLSFTGLETTAPNPTAGKMSDFTSWGLTPNLDFKPEITAPGGNIYSTIQDNQYGVKSGTSMAAPHVAGGSAIVLQRVDEEFNLEGKDRVELAKNIMMNTASPVQDKGTIQGMFGFDNPYSPRRQGAGLMQLHAALSTPVVVTEKTTGEAKVALKEVEDQISFTLRAENFTDETVSYDVSANVQTDLALFGELGYTADELEAQELSGAVVTINGGNSNLEIPANGSVEFVVEINLADAKVLNANASAYVDPETIFPNGYFVEGYVSLYNEALPELTLPYVGFNGDWNAAPVLDELAYDDHNSFYEAAAMLYAKGDEYYYLGFNPFAGEEGANEKARIAISPNGDGEKDQIIPYLSFLRNAKEVKYNVLDEDKNHLRTIRSEKNVRKNYYDRALNPMATLKADFAWDGKVNKQVVADGLYYYEVAPTIDYPGKEAQQFLVPVMVDTVAPTLEGSVNGKVLSLNADDELSGLSHIEVLVDGESLFILPGDTETYEFENGLPVGNVTVVAVDNAGNVSEAVEAGVNDDANPVITVQTPATFSVHNTSDVEVAGTISDETEIVEFTVNGQEAELGWDEENSVYTFSTTVTFEDGANPINLVAVDAAGNEHTLSNSRMIFVDTTAPVLEVDVDTEVGSDVDSVKLTAHLSDNAEELRFFVNGSEEFFNEMPGYDMVPYSTEVTTTVSLEPGENVFHLELVDLAGNVTEEEVVINRNMVDRISGANSLETSVQVSEEGFESSDVVVLARHDNYADALAGIPLAKKFDAPMLLTRTAALPDITMAEIERLGASTVYILGGTGAVSTEVEEALEAEGITVERLSGKSKFETAVAIAHEVAPDGAAEAVVVNGNHFADALSVASYAGDKGMPILLTTPTNLPAATAKAIDDLGVESTVVVGGTAAVSAEVAAQLPDPERVSGKTKYQTSVEIAKYFNEGATHFYVATGNHFADALSGAALAAKESTGILLVGNSVHADLATFIEDEGVETLTVLGGKNAVSVEVANHLASLLK